MRAVAAAVLPRRSDLDRFLAGAGDGASGVAAIEFAIIGPLLILAMVVTADLGMGIYRKMQVQSAAQAGAQYAAARGFNAAAVAGAVTAATTFPGVSASPAPAQFCGCPTADGITGVACDAKCGGTSPAGTYVTVAAQGNYATIIPYPLMPSSFVLTGQSTVRLQ